MDLDMRQHFVAALATWRLVDRTKEDCCVVEDRNHALRNDPSDMEGREGVIVKRTVRGIKGSVVDVASSAIDLWDLAMVVVRCEVMIGQSNWFRSAGGT